jgi:Flp pilus assembly pilin Flp
VLTVIIAAIAVAAASFIKPAVSGALQKSQGAIAGAVGRLPQ